MMFQDFPSIAAVVLYIINFNLFKVDEGFSADQLALFMPNKTVDEVSAALHYLTLVQHLIEPPIFPAQNKGDALDFFYCDVTDMGLYFSQALNNQDFTASVLIDHIQGNAIKTQQDIDYQIHTFLNNITFNKTVKNWQLESISIILQTLNAAYKNNYITQPLIDESGQLSYTLTDKGSVFKQASMAIPEVKAPLKISEDVVIQVDYQVDDI